MKTRSYTRLTLIGAAVVVIVGGFALAIGRGGGGGGAGGARVGGGGGGGGARPAMSGGGSVRYSSPRPAQTPSAAQRPAGSPSPGVRPTPAPSAGQRPAGAPSAGSPAAGARPSTPSGVRPGGGVAASPLPNRGSISRADAPVYRPSNLGSISGEGGGSLAGNRGAAGIRGPNGGGAGAVWTPGGAAGAGIRGPNGGAVGAARGPRDGRYLSNLPNGASRYNWNGQDCWHHGYNWYRPGWYGGGLGYYWMYPPIGYYYNNVPDDTTTTIVNNTTYYVDPNGVYYQPARKNGQSGYQVVEAPQQATAAATASPSATPDASSGSAGAAVEDRDPFLILKSMCDYIAGQKEFTAIVRTTFDEIGEAGEKIQDNRKSVVSISRPDKLCATITGDKTNTQVFFDGKTLSLLDTRKNLYSTVSLPGTLDDVMAKLTKDLGMVLPLGDLIYSNAYERISSRIETGQYLGISKVGENSCHHLAFSRKSTDLEVWIDSGSSPVLRKVSVDHKDDSSRPRFTALVVAWMESPTFTDNQFDFTPPVDAKQIPIGPNQKGN